MKQLTEQERLRWVRSAAYVAPAFEILTAGLAGDRDLGKKLARGLHDENTRSARLWPLFLTFLRDCNSLEVWDEFCLWLARFRADVACGVEVGYLDLWDELAHLADELGNQEEE